MQRENNERGRNFERAKTAIIGNTYKKLISLVERYAQEDLPVLFFGETGTGKELFAELYFAVSQRRGEKKSVNCAQFRGDLLNSEVFGHKKGAFTGAVYDRKGKLKYCSKGILFLDELGASTPEFQAAILRVSEEHPYNPVGSDEDEKTETLLIAATSSLSQIREDLMYRFHILPVPPLQRQDIPMLAQHFLKGPPTKDTLEPLMSQDYPGNVRHLKRECQRLVAEKGKSVVCSTKALPGAALPINSFDYERYRQEVEMWNKHILPISSVPMLFE